MSIVVVIPAHSEAGYIEACLHSLLKQTAPPAMHVIVSANACTDDTVARAQALGLAFETAGHRLVVIDSPVPGKPGALNRAEAAIPADMVSAPRVYLDADVRCAPELIGQIADALAPSVPLYATGTIEVTRGARALTRAYTGIWVRLPFVQQGTVGAGFFAVNAAGRALWGPFPDLISDDTFVRLQFTPAQRLEVPARYFWPMVEGFTALVRVRRRQNAGVTELAQLYPQIMVNEAKAPLGLRGALRLALRRPFGFALYVAVQLAVYLTGYLKGHLKGRAGGARHDWTRGR